MMSKNPPHSWHFQLTPDAFEVFRSMQPGHKRSFLNALRQLVNADDPFSLPFVEMLKDKKFQRLRKFRVGHYRMFFDVSREEVMRDKFVYRGTVIILDIRQRGEAY